VIRGMMAAAASCHVAVPPTSAHKLWLRFEGGFTDSSTLAHPIANSGATLDTAIRAEGASSARISTAQNANVITVPHHADLNIVGGDFTIGCRVRFSSLAGASVVYTKSSATGFYPYQLIRDSANAFVFRGFDASGSIAFSVSSGSGSVQADAWYRVQCRRSGGTFAMAVNGAQVADAVYAGGLRDQLDITAVGNYGSGGYPVVGWLDDVTFDAEALAFDA
jgi:ethanolamine utilization microcompartment shell protein EutS